MGPPSSPPNWLRLNCGTGRPLRSLKNEFDARLLGAVETEDVPLESVRTGRCHEPNRGCAPRGISARHRRDNRQLASRCPRSADSERSSAHCPE